MELRENRKWQELPPTISILLQGISVPCGGFGGGFLYVPYVLGLSVFSYRQVWLFTAGSKAHLLAEGGGCLVPGSSRVTPTRLPRAFRVLFDSWKRP